MADPNTRKDSHIYLCVTPQPVNLNQGQFEALTWVEIGKVGKVGDGGVSTNIVTYPLLAADLSQKAKGDSEAQTTSIECARDLTDAGQIAIRAAALTRYSYAMKFVNGDAPSADFASSITYRRGVIVGPEEPGGGSEDFQLNVFMLGQNQRPLEVAAAALSVPVNATVPSITGAEVRVGFTLTANVGSWTNEPTSYQFQWQHDVSGNLAFVNVAVGGTSQTYVPVVGDIADSLRVQVTATNAAGASAAASSLPTTVIIAA